MIEEAYVSFEMAKLLKEKGFNERCNALYNEKGLLSCGNTFTFNSNMMLSRPDYALAPTQQMAMRWLREVYGIHISIYLFDREKPVDSDVLYTCDIATKELSSQNGHLRGVWKTYEEAVEDGIKYCLKHLI